MKKYVALLRGINVGGNNKISMPELKKTFQAQGYKEVITYINSGNVIFQTEEPEKKLAQEIERVIEQQFNLKIKVLVCTQDLIESVCNKIPETWQNNAEEKTDIMFLWDEYAKTDSLELLTINKTVDTVVYFEGVLIWHLNKTDYSKSGMHKIIGTKLYKNMTVRNVNTVRKILSLMSD